MSATGVVPMADDEKGFSGCPQCGCDSFTHHQEYARNVLGLSYDEGWGMDNEWQEWDTCDRCGEVIE